uniref:DUF1618 domain-containing protein n=1 Tax=Oryza meridionalis TaxID=40149 RepID=A0A0E0BZS6_9ORYZ
MAPPPSSPTWVFLNRKARVCGGSEPVLPQGADDVSLELAAPPRESVLTVSSHSTPPRGLSSSKPPSPPDSAGTASRVPYPGEPTLNDDLGVIAAPGGGGNYMVVEFKPVLGDDGEDDDTMFVSCGYDL